MCGTLITCFEAGLSSTLQTARSELFTCRNVCSMSAPLSSNGPRKTWNEFNEKTTKSPVNGNLPEQSEKGAYLPSRLPIYDSNKWINHFTWVSKSCDLQSRLNAFPNQNTLSHLNNFSHAFRRQLTSNPNSFTREQSQLHSLSW